MGANVGSRNESVKTFSDGTKKQLKNRCHSFDPTTEKWREDCETVYDENAEESGVLCLCKHNTSFAVLMSPYEIDPGFIESQTLMTTILLSLAMICLLLTLVFLLPAAPLRKQRSTKINICFSFSLLLASFLFLLQNSLVKPDNSGPIKLGSPGCIAYAAIQHYLWLVVFLWMVVEGVLMYLSLVQVFGSHISKYMLKFNLAAWGIPLPIPFIGYFVFTKKHTVGSFDFTDHGYLADTMCFIKPDSVPFYALFLAPIVLVVLINLVFFALVAKVIKNSKSSGNISDQEQILRHIYVGSCSAVPSWNAVPLHSPQQYTGHFRLPVLHRAERPSEVPLASQDGTPRGKEDHHFLLRCRQIGRHQGDGG